MPFLTIGALVDVPVLTEGGASRNESIYTGERVRTINGTLRYLQRNKKDSWTWPVGAVSLAYEASLRALQDGVAKTCSGDALGGTKSCFVFVGESEFIADGTGFLLSVSVTLEEA